MGHKVNYIPGWDCHGLPIELKALQKAQTKGETTGNWENFSSLDIRKKAEDLALTNIKIQKKVFKQWGLLTNWNNYYLTMNPSYVIKEIELFKKLYDKGYIFQAYMPVHFSPSSKTSLAESELEYNNDHESPSLYLALPLCHDESHLLLKNWTNRPPIYLCIWTTTPWTLPGNTAISINEDKDYTLVLTKLKEKEAILVWMSDRIKELPFILNSSYSIITQVKGRTLKGLNYFHPIYSKLCPVICSQNVSSNKGTGLVHTAPAHGKEDFIVALELGIPTDVQLVDDNGHYKEEAGEHLRGKSVLEEGNEEVIKLLGRNDLNQCKSSSIILNLGTIVHSYPYDWRTKKPTIIRASMQWFFDVRKVKKKVEKALKKVSIHPEKSRLQFISLLAKRPYWCLSRQRVWGVPIPVFYDSESGEPLIESQFIEHLSALIEKEGADVWWKYSEEELLPAEYVKKLMSEGKSLPKKGTDILDIWFDSGSSWYCVMDGKKSDVYLEGQDQISGWFQSSMLTSVACTGEAPFKSLVLHGFTIDEHHRKMSKSLKNVFDPVLITEGGKDLKASPAFGTDVLRFSIIFLFCIYQWYGSHLVIFASSMWWTVRSDFTKDIHFGMDIMQVCEAEILALRNSFSFFIGNLHNFDSDALLPYRSLRVYDQYVLSLIDPFLKNVWKLYEEFNYSEAAREIYNFIVEQIGNTHLNTAKDILYFEKEDDIRRKSVQSTIYYFLPYLIKSLEPILPYLCEEVKSHYYKISKNVEDVTNPPSEWNEFESKICENILNIKKDFDVKWKEMNEDSLKEGKAVDTKKSKVHISVGKNLESNLKVFQSSAKDSCSDLCSLLLVSEVTLDFDHKIPDDFQLNILEAEERFCERCRKHLDCDELCDRCERVISDVL
ncbi:Isoleucine--tRNA ligase, mitochondrial [Armadillidium nasatum]|uniref:isoleucine--tRNA ligase n=1 Tax=Armadillidium nasatum TaxID=96803 RepID=A0A5N5TJB6_9CRUS|nr:Isoleucine--tRNA ligase, mitochondrial [Armadillidium nasatum]